MGSVVRELLARRWLAWHAALVVVLVSFVLLGRWQWHSYESSGRAERAAQSQVAVPVATVLTPGGRLGSGDAGRTVTATGRFDAAHQLLVPGRRRHGTDGYLVVTPLRTDSAVLAVVRGWVASGRSPAVRVPPGGVRISAVLQPSESDQDSRVDPLAPPAAGQIPYLDTVQLLNAWPFPPEQLYDGYAVLTAQHPAASPAPEPVPPRAFHGGIARWRNLAYALQWWLFAGAAVFFWWAVIRRSATERDSDDDSDAATGSDVPAGTLG
ncbi:MAG: hypothetical protein QOJ90_1898 [Actinomycetota bacterium]|nr:hypothetical protein [Actinomycetota bacterium]MDQ1642547.1 hypothetical protein [Actinomycetota bacterium]